MIRQLYGYFGVIGFAAIAAWLTAWVVLAVSARHARRNQRWLMALGIAVLAWVLALWNSHRVNLIEVDRTAEIEAARLRAEQQAAAAEPVKRFAEDEPAYRAAGKQERTPGRQGPALDAASAAVTEEAVARTLPAAEVERANRWDRLNLIIVRFTLLVCLAAVAWDWLERLTDPEQGYLPLPVTGRWLDELFPHRRTGRRSLPAGLTAKEFLEIAARKGQSFLYLGRQDPWPATASVPRLRVGRWTFRCLPKLAPHRNGDVGDAEFLFESVWYNRYGVVITDESHARQLLRELEAYLEMRRQTRATTRRSVPVVWDFPSTAPDGRLVDLCAATNLELVVAGRAGAG